MPFILFTLIEETQKINPFNQAGAIHNAGLDYIIANIGIADVAQLATDYIVVNYTINEIYPAQTIDPISVKGFNVTVNPTDTLADIDLGGFYNEYIEKVFSYIDIFPPTQGENTLSQSSIIFNPDYLGQFDLDTSNLVNAILDSGLPVEQMNLALIAISILNYSYAYWRNVYNNSGSSGEIAWYAYITGFVNIDNFDWREVIKQDIKGALQGAVLASQNNFNNYDGSLTIGAATASMASSAQNIVLQTGVVSPRFTDLYNFNIYDDGVEPLSTLINIGNVLYGTCNGGGLGGVGTIFSINTDGSNYTKLHDFDTTNGSTPNFGLTNVAGVLYGATTLGGTNNVGVLFCINPDGSGFTKLHDFDTTNGASPYWPLIVVAGALYGTTSLGGVDNLGIMFSINPDGSDFTKLYDFDATAGSPFAPLIEISGILYGTAGFGGFYGYGAIFSINSDGSGFAILHSFDATDGLGPEGNLAHVDGALFGTTSGGSVIGFGVIYGINLDGSGFFVLDEFDGANGSYPVAGLVYANGILYGVTVEGGTDDAGIIFSIKPDGTAFKNLYNFSNSFPETPFLNINGMLYSVVPFGGPEDGGFIYSLGPI